MCLLYIVFYYYTWLWKTTKTLERKLNQTKTDAQQNPDTLRMECKKHQSRMNVYAGCNDVLYSLYNRFLKEKLEFTSEFLVFSLFDEVQHLLDSILVVDFCYPSLVELYYGSIEKKLLSRLVDFGHQGVGGWVAGGGVE